MFDGFETTAPIFNVGIDCEDIQRWRKMWPKFKTGPHRKLFSDKEHRYCMSFKDPVPHYAVRWCAKEALLKALAPFYKVDIRVIEINNDDEGRPYFVINDPEIVKMSLMIRLSLSHTRITAFAMVMVACINDRK